jgi:demethylmenaquinone methyltransferase/2-methoxy-6-polyprenyl-1,4-benzoquinol methylase
MTRAHEDKQPHEVATMFDELAGTYDLLNDVLSAGQDRTWRRAVLRAVDARDGEVVLDLAAGTGSSSAPFVRSGAAVVACDFSLGMLQHGKRVRPRLSFVAGDATRLPFADSAFDVATISFGLRNVVDTDAALREMLRVTRPGGRLLVCEFSRPTTTALRRAYQHYLRRVLTPVASWLTQTPEAYDYLGESIRAWPDQPALAGKITAAGWSAAGWRNLTGGIVALHRARRP